MEHRGRRGAQGGGEGCEQSLRALSNPDPEVATKALSEFESKYPALGHIPYFVGPKITLLIKTKKFDEAKKMAEEVMAKAEKMDDSSMLRNVSAALRAKEAKGQKELSALGVKAAEASLKMTGEKDVIGLFYVAEAYFAAGDKAKARRWGRKPSRRPRPSPPRTRHSSRSRSRSTMTDRGLHHLKKPGD